MLSIKLQLPYNLTINIIISFILGLYHTAITAIERNAIVYNTMKETIPYPPCHAQSHTEPFTGTATNFKT